MCLVMRLTAHLKIQSSKSARSVKLFLMERMHGLISSGALFGLNKFAMGESRSCFSLGKKTRYNMREGILGS